MSEAEKNFTIDYVGVNSCRFHADVPVYMITQMWQPSAKLDIDVRVKPVENHLNQHVVELQVDVWVHLSEQSVFSLNVVQVGCFTIVGYEGESFEHLTQIFCPNLLFPYAREAVSRMVCNAGFPALNLHAIDFETRYHNRHQSV